MAEAGAEGLSHLHVCGHFKHHPIIKDPFTPPNVATLLSPCDVETPTARSLPLSFILGQTPQRRRFVSLKTHVSITSKEPGNKSGGWQHRTNTLISHCFLLYLVEDEGGVVYSGISRTVKAKRTYRLAHSASVQTSGTVCGQSQ